MSIRNDQKRTASRTTYSPREAVTVAIGLLYVSASRYDHAAEVVRFWGEYADRVTQEAHGLDETVATFDRYAVIARQQARDLKARSRGFLEDVPDSLDGCIATSEVLGVDEQSPVAIYRRCAALIAERIHGGSGRVTRNKRATAR